MLTRSKKIGNAIKKGTDKKTSLDVPRQVPVKIEDQKFTEPTISEFKDVKNSESKKLRGKLKLIGQTPFPEWPKPSHQDCNNVLRALAEQHGMPKKPQKVLIKSEGFSANCGGVPDVLEALIRTILSQNTSNTNSSRAKAGIDEVFGGFNYEKIIESPEEDLVRALMPGGLANRKAKQIRTILEKVFEEHKQYSLNHLHDPKYTDQEIIDELTKYSGVGYKTASCVLLFCLSRDSFAVDTHVFRISKALGWVPQKATREDTFLHLDYKLPNSTKYPLHVLMIKHGKSCQRCAKLIRHNLKSKDECSIQTYLKV